MGKISIYSKYTELSILNFVGNLHPFPIPNVAPFLRCLSFHLVSLFRARRSVPRRYDQPSVNFKQITAGIIRIGGLVELYSTLHCT